MELWTGSIPDYVQEVKNQTICGKMLAKFYHLHGSTPNNSELVSWENSLDHFCNIINDLKSLDIGLIVEYHLPMSEKRLDIMCMGKNKLNEDSGLIIENKQWSEGELLPGSPNIKVMGEERQHPSDQALGYAKLLCDTHSSFHDKGIKAYSCSFLHNVSDLDNSVFVDNRFQDIICISPPFNQVKKPQFQEFIKEKVGHGHGVELMMEVSQGYFHPNKKLIQTVCQVIAGTDRWLLLDEQKVAYNAILAEVRQRIANCASGKSSESRSVIMLTGGPGTGKSVIAIQLLGDALRSGYRVAHSTGSKAFTRTLQGLFKDAPGIFIWNRTTRNKEPMDLDLLIVDEAHRIRATSDIRFTKASARNKKSQLQEIIDASKVTVMLLDENQYVRPDEIGTPSLIRDYCKNHEIPLKEFNLTTQYRCNGSTGYIDWIGKILGFTSNKVYNFRNEYQFRIVDSIEELEREVLDCHDKFLSARLVAGFCWLWSKPRDDDSLVNDVKIGEWSKPWNRKESKKYYRPDQHPYYLWATSRDGVKEVGCIYSSQGFEFEHVGVIFGPDLVRREDKWIFNRDESYDKAIKIKKADPLSLVRNAYRVLLTRGIRSTSVLFIDDETHDYVKSELERIK